MAKNYQNVRISNRAYKKIRYYSLAKGMKFKMSVDDMVDEIYRLKKIHSFEDLEGDVILEDEIDMAEVFRIKSDLNS